MNFLPVAPTAAFWGTPPVLGPTHERVLWVESTHRGGDASLQRAPAKPCCRSELDLLRQGQGIIDLDPEVTDGAFDLRMAEQQLHCSKVACLSVIKAAFVRRTECVPNEDGSRPISDSHSESSRAYCLVVRW